MADILILDDDVETQRLLASALSPLGCKVALARRISEARRLIDEKVFDLVVVDGLLPDGNGTSFITELRDAGCPSKIVFISSFFRSIDHYRKLTRELGVAQVMAKPFSAQEFLVQVRALLSSQEHLPPVSRVVDPPGVVVIGPDEPQPTGVEPEAVDTPAPGASSPPADDPDLRPADPDVHEALKAQLAVLHAAYAKSLGEKVGELVDALEGYRADGARPPLADARLAVHKMHGTAGSYGFTVISDEAGKIERHLRIWLDRLDGKQNRDDDEEQSDDERWQVVDRALARIRAEVDKVEGSGVEGEGVEGEGAGAEQRSDAAQRFTEGIDLTHTAPPPQGPPSTTGGAATLLFVDDDEDFLARISLVGEQAVTRVLTATNAAEAVYRARSHKIDAAVIDVLLADGESPQDVAEQLRRLPGYQALPLAFISGDGRLQNRQAAVHAGVSLFLNKPLTQEEFVEAAHQLTSADRQQQARVLIIDDDTESSKALRQLLEQHGYEAHELADALQVIDTIDELRPDLLLLDLMMPEISGFDICKMVRANPRWQIPLLVMTGQTSSEVRVAAFGAGADDFLVKPLIKEELLVRLDLRTSQAREARNRSDRDPLTGLLSRRAFIRSFPSRLDEVRRRQTVLSLCLVDLDHFKQINDTYGHLAGDRVLAHFGRMLSIRFRGSDLRCRWGGEEFIVVFVGENEIAAAEILDRVRQEFHDVVFTGDTGAAFSASFSAGISSYPADGKTLEDLLRTADERLYRAKHHGRAQTHTGQFPPVRQSKEKPAEA